MPDKRGRNTYGGFQQPPATGHSSHEQHVLRVVYGTCRQQHPSEDPEDKARCARIAWAAAKKYG